jgi:hypothetical protein
LPGQLEPEGGKLWVYDIDGTETLAFTSDCIEAFAKSSSIRSIKPDDPGTDRSRGAYGV